MQADPIAKDTSDCKIMAMMYGSKISGLKYWINLNIRKNIPAPSAGIFL